MEDLLLDLVAVSEHERDGAIEEFIEKVSRNIRSGIEAAPSCVVDVTIDITPRWPRF